jgi:hypothetical protein
MRVRGLAAAILLFPVLALAAVAAPVTVEQLARRSDVVLRARVRTLESTWSGDHKRIETRAVLDPIDVWRGAVPGPVVVIVPGGVVGDLAQSVSGAPAFSPGEEVVVFLEKDALAPRRATAQFRVSGMAQGKLKIDPGGATATPALENIAFVEKSLPEGERRISVMALSELEQRVKAVKP